MNNMEILILLAKIIGILLIIAVVLILYTMKKMIDIASNCEQCSGKMQKGLDKHKRI